VLVEPTSAVDAHTEARIAQSLHAVRARRTTLVFSSSPLMLDRADRVVLVRGTRVSATGTHRELLRTDALYRAIVTRETEPKPEPEPEAHDAPGGTTRSDRADRTDGAGGPDGADGRDRAGATDGVAVSHAPGEGEPQLAGAEGTEGP
jgi:ABC-type multidrug transport system ATPase subunit